MNWIAHIFLSEYNIDFQIGNYLADPLKGKVWEDANANFINGMKIHKIIDSYTDKNLLFKRSKQRIGSGLLRGVVIDLTYDYLLSKNWDKFSNIPLDIFFNKFNTDAKRRLKYIPQNARIPLENLIKYDIVNRYKKIDDLQTVFSKVDKRLSSRVLKKDNNSSYYKAVSQNIFKIEEDFLEFFPQLTNHIKNHMHRSKLNHWKI